MVAETPLIREGVVRRAIRNGDPVVVCRGRLLNLTRVHSINERNLSNRSPSGVRANSRILPLAPRSTRLLQFLWQVRT